MLPRIRSSMSINSLSSVYFLTVTVCHDCIVLWKRISLWGQGLKSTEGSAVSVAVPSCHVHYVDVARDAVSDIVNAVVNISFKKMTFLNE